MIMRIWRGKVPIQKTGDYLAYLKRTGLAEYRKTFGNLGVFVTTRALGDITEFAVVTFWDSKASIQEFAGPNLDTAIYYPDDDQYLLHREPKVEHYDVGYAAPAFG